MTLHQAPPLERYRAELIGYAYRVLGSRFEAEDAVQETLLRAWRAHDRFEGRATLRTWLYRIARNVCLDMLAHPQRRTVPMDPPTATDAESQIEPMSPDAHPWSSSGDPAEAVVARESVRQAFMVAVQHLPPRQRAVLLMCEVLRWRASEAAEMLGTSVASVNSALQRARVTLAARQDGGAPKPMNPEHRALLGRYTDAFERDDIPSLTALVRAEAISARSPLTPTGGRPMLTGNSSPEQISNAPRTDTRRAIPPAEIDAPDQRTGRNARRHGPNGMRRIGAGRNDAGRPELTSGIRGACD